MVESSNKVKPWRQSVKFAALNAELPTITGPVKLEITFYLARPKGHYRTGKHAGEVKESAPQYPATRPDTSKLVRSTEDALTEAGVYKDDSQVVTLVAMKRYADTRPPGATITIRQA